MSKEIIARLEKLKDIMPVEERPCCYKCKKDVLHGGYLIPRPNLVGLLYVCGGCAEAVLDALYGEEPSQPESNHFVEKCRLCERVTNQCRCMSENKTVRWTVCVPCSQKEMNRIYGT